MEVLEQKMINNKTLLTCKIINYQTVEKNQLKIIFPFLGHLSFQTRDRLNSCLRNQKQEIRNLLVHGVLHFSEKPVYLAYLNSKRVFLNTFACILFINFRVVAAVQLIMVKLRDTFLNERRSIWESLH